MATAIRKCRVCGEPYEYCHTAKRVGGVFRWQDVACSPECGSIYLAQIKASRAKNATGTDAGERCAAKFPWSESEEIYEDKIDCA